MERGFFKSRLWEEGDEVMSVRFIIGRAGSGKSHRCLEEIRGKLLEGATGNPLIWLVPEQATFQSELALVTTPGLNGVIRAQVLSFRRLAFRIMQETGGTARIHIAETGKKMMLHTIVNRRKNELRLFSAAADHMGFIDKMNELFNEFKRYCVSSERLEHHLLHRVGLVGDPPIPADKLHDLVLLYQDYEREMSRHYIDSEDYLAILSSQLLQSAYAREAEVWIDGFYGFTPQEYKVIEQMMRSCRKVTVTLCLDRPYEAGEKPDELDLFHPTAMTMIRLRELAAELGLRSDEIGLETDESASRFRNSPMLAYLEHNYARGTKRRGYPPVMDTSHSSISIHTAVHRRAEAEGVAREIIRLVRDEHYRWRDIAVMIRNIPDYADLLATVFKDYGIPYFFDQKRTVMHHPLVEFIRSAWEVINNNWRYDAVFRCIKTDFLLPLDEVPDVDFRGLPLRQAMDQLENYALAFGIQGTRWTDALPWKYQLRSSLEEEESSDPDGTSAAYLAQINACRGLVTAPLLAFQKRVKVADDVTGMTEALFDLLESARVPERLEAWSRECSELGKPEQAREHLAIWGSVMDLLDQLVEMMGEQQLSPEVFARILETGLESIKLGLVPPSLDQVLIGSMDRTRSSQVKYAFILGVNDGILPARVNEDGILSEAERELLSHTGLELAPGSRRKLLDESFLIYTALTIPSDRLWLSYPLADEEGKSLLPSETIRHMKALFPSIEHDLLTGEPSAAQSTLIQASYIAHPERALSYLTVQLRQWKRGEPIGVIWWDVYNWFCGRPEWRSRLQVMTSALFYRNEAAALSASISLQLYGERLRASVSRMERFVACPFSQFASYGLRLEERRVYRLEAPDIGQLFHAALSNIALQLQKDRMDWGELSAMQCRERAKWAVDELAPRLQSEILLSSKRYRYIANKLQDIVGRAAVVLGEHARHGAFRPVGLELAFGPQESVPPLIYKLDNGVSMEIVGRIDRVDAAEGAQGLLLRVIDYKSSQRSLQLAEAFYGLSLQMLTYLDVMITHAEAWLGRKALPAGVLYFHVHNPLLRLHNAISQEQAEEKLFKRFKMKGLVLEDPHVVSLMDSALVKGHSKLIPVALKANGEFYKQSSVYSERQWSALSKHVRQTMRGIGTEITNGNVDIRPYRMGNKAACTYCSFKPVCQFDALFEGNDYRPLPLQSKDAIWKRIEEKLEDSNEEHDSNPDRGGAGRETNSF